MKLKLTPKQANLILYNIPKGSSISGSAKDLDKIMALAQKAKGK